MKTTIMSTPRLIHIMLMTLLLLAPSYVLAQEHGHRPGSEGAATKQIQGMIQQMGGMMEHMVDRIESGPMTSEHTKQMGDMMGHRAEMMHKLGGMMDNATAGAGKPGSALMGPEMSQQMTTMMERMTDMHKRMMGMMPTSAAPQPDKK